MNESFDQSKRVRSEHYFEFFFFLMMTDLLVKLKFFGKKSALPKTSWTIEMECTMCHALIFCFVPQHASSLTTPLMAPWENMHIGGADLGSGGDGYTASV